jgi:hypothetical protein
MKILKRPENVIFDTENPDKMEFKPIPKYLPAPLSEITLKTDWEFLSVYFKQKEGIEHPIFNSFGSSYFYCVSV